MVKRSSEDIKELMKPIVGLSGEYIADGGETPLGSTGVRITVPTYPVWGPPPPMVNLGYEFTWLDTPGAWNLPSEFHEYRIGASWIRTLSDNWKTRAWAGISINTEGENTSSDALQFRGGLLAIYSSVPEYEWIMGVVALGRSDLPAVPALGLNYRPHEDWTFEFTFPRPQATYTYKRSFDRQLSVFMGGGLNGTTWAYLETNGQENQLTYSDWRIVCGWESAPLSNSENRFTPGKRIRIETGYVFDRELEFETLRPTISLNDAWTVNVLFSY
ncbi:MAG: hypothetical protein KDA65_08955 [Planctomycetaceae bacterium]|nr:hypothetical protein [Planctomycetaceae bacterium]